MTTPQLTPVSTIQHGLMSNADIIQAMLDGDIQIFPFDQKNLTGIGYNLSPTEFVLSIKRGALEQVHSNGLERYVYIQPHDTVLTFTREYVRVSQKYAGTFHSKVKRVSQGLGHIGTTLDPTWKGQLIISINNPTSRRIKFILSESGCLCTLLFYRLTIPAKALGGLPEHDNDQGRALILKEYISTPPRFLSPIFRKYYAILKNYIEEDLVPSLNGKTIEITPETENLSACRTYVEQLLYQINTDTLSLGSEGYIRFSHQYISQIKNLTLYKLDKLNSSEEPVFMPLCVANQERHNGKDCTIDSNTLNSPAEKQYIVHCLETLIRYLNYDINQEQHRERIKKQIASVQRVFKPNKLVRMGNFIKNFWPRITILLALVILFIVFAFLFGKSVNFEQNWFINYFVTPSLPPIIITTSLISVLLPLLMYRKK